LDLNAKWTSRKLYSKCEIQFSGPNFGALYLLKYRVFSLSDHNKFADQSKENNFAEESKPCSCEQFGDNHAQTWTVKLIQSESQVDSDFAPSLRAILTLIQCSNEFEPYSRIIAGL
jgi:DNA-binding transcriptional regulator of glucitol operon